MATVERRQQGTGPVRYRVRWRDDAGRQKSRTFDRRRDADQWRTKVEHDLLSGIYVDPAAGRVTFRGYATEWLKLQIWTDDTTQQVRRTLEAHVYPSIGDRPIGRLRRSDIAALYSSMGKTLAGSTANVYAGYVNAILTSAAADRVIPSSPVGDLKRPVAKSPEVVPPTPTQVELLVHYGDARHRALLVTLAGLGLRIGEAQGLTVDRVDFLGRTVRIDQQAIWSKGLGVQLSPRLKTEASYRTLPLPETVSLALAHHIEVHGLGEGGVIFHGKGGRPIGRGTARDAMHRAADAANEAAEALVPFPLMYHPHDLRHFYASALIAAGHSVETVRARLGHSKASITLDVYGHLWPDNEDETRQAIDAVLSRVAWA